jgi:hypothetical protein
MSIDWLSVKEDFESKGIGFRELALKHKCSDSAIRNRAKRESWKKKLSVEEISAEHRKILSILRERAEEVILKNESVVGIEKLKEMKAEADLFSVIVKIERLVWWIEESGQEDDENIDELVKEMDQATHAPGAGEALERR